LEIDPPQHTFYRALMNPLFTPARMAALESSIRDFARSLIGELKREGRCDFVAQFAREFPIKVFLRLMGLPLDLAPQFLAWENALISAESIEQIAYGVKEVARYLGDEIAKREEQPRDDFITYGVQANLRGRKMSPDELLGYCFTLYSGGLDTVASHMGHHFRHLAEHPEHQQTLREQPGMIGDAVDELMRAYASVSLPRRCVKAREIGGVQVHPGDRLLISLPLAGRDPDEYERPHEVILERKPKHLSFGCGTHICIGIHLARRELRIAIEEFLKEIPPFRISADARIDADLGPVLQLKNLPLVWD
jgi:cytochrome P450